jgi:hypothetical protein
VSSHYDKPAEDEEEFDAGMSEIENGPERHLTEIGGIAKERGVHMEEHDHNRSDCAASLHRPDRLIFTCWFGNFTSSSSVRLPDDAGRWADLLPL